MSIALLNTEIVYDHIQRQYYTDRELSIVVTVSIIILNVMIYTYKNTSQVMLVKFFTELVPIGTPEACAIKPFTSVF